MLVQGCKRFQLTLDLNPADRDDLARELVRMLNQPDNKDCSPKLFQLLSVVEAIEHGDTKNLDVVSVDEP